MNPTLRRRLFAPALLSTIILIGIYLFFGAELFVLATLLIALEVTLSFDNAVVNAKVLERMSPSWQKRFLTWGMLIAVVGTRLLLPVLIVAACVSLSPLVVAHLALFNANAYGALLAQAHPSISSFGGVFLLMVSLKYFFDEYKEVHWISSIEKYLPVCGRIEAAEIGSSLILLVLISLLVPEEQATILVAGCVGIITFVAMEGITGALKIESKGMVQSGFALFMYLNVLDSAFSLDGVVGAFALTTSLPIIIVALGLGAYMVRALTLFMVERGTLSKLIYLEHGAHWAIFGLGLSMLVSLMIPVPEAVTGGIGFFFITWSYFSSHKHNRKISAVV